MNNSWVLQPFSNRTEVAGKKRDSITQRQYLAGLNLQSSRGIRQPGEKQRSKEKQNERKQRWNKILLLICTEDELLSYHCGCKWKPCQKGVTSKGRQIKYVFFLALCRECARLQKVSTAKAEKQNKCVPHTEKQLEVVYIATSLQQSDS